MKKIIILTAIAYFTSMGFELIAQDVPDVQLNPSQYDNGYNVSCNGSNNGSIETIAFGGTSPYAFLWSNGATTQNLSNLPAGVYTVTITDWNNYSTQREIELSQPDPLEINLFASEFPGGTNISEQGANDGNARSEIGGGAPPYSFLWSNGSDGEVIDGLTAGTYTLTVTDMNGCSSSNNITLIEPTQLHIVSINSPLHNGYNVSCHKGGDGSVNLTVAGGIPPYQYQWNNGSMEQNPTELNARLYMVRVTDANGAEIIGQITLTQPPVLTVQLTPYVYGNGYNVSSYNASNGSITLSLSGGVGPFTYQWQTGQTTANLSNLGPWQYDVLVTDANNCQTLKSVTLTQPEQDVWSRWGNTGTNPSNEFIGTYDNQDFSFRSNNIERLRIKANGDLKISSFAGNGNRLVLVDGNGKIFPGGISFPPCTGSPVIAFQQSPYNTNDIFSCYRRFGIGTDSPQDNLEVKGAVRFTAWDPNMSNNSNYLKIMHDGGNSRIDNFGNGDLLINYGDNYNTGMKSVRICTGNSGDVETGGNTFLATGTGKNVGIGTYYPSEKLDIDGRIVVRGSNLVLGSDDGRPYNGGLALVHSDLSSGPIDDQLILNYNHNYQGGVQIDDGQFGGITLNAINQGIVLNTGAQGIKVPSLQAAQGTTSILQIDENGLLSATNANNANVGYWHAGQATGSIFYSDGNVGIGTDNPSHTSYFPTSSANNKVLHIKGDWPVIRLEDDLQNANTLPSNFEISAHNGTGRLISDYSIVMYLDANNDNTDECFRILKNGPYWNASATEIFKVNQQGTACAMAMKVTINGFPDYVFNTDYKLMPLEILAEYIKTNKHLPEIPTAEEVEKNDLDLGDITSKLVKKVEELTLYVIDLKKENDQLKERLNKIEKHNK